MEENNCEREREREREREAEALALLGESGEGRERERERRERPKGQQRVLILTHVRVLSKTHSAPPRTYVHNIDISKSDYESCTNNFPKCVASRLAGENDAGAVFLIFLPTTLSLFP